ncbi:hypothetical protein GCM10009765_01390 [Fodinicola feengrottensis]|uniref:Cell wall protein n=1 Tax=Fodinicola feengrottensis TaxID=435914 RepID=A0ABN2FPK0_9ACTN
MDRRTFLTGAVLGSAAIVGATTFGGTDPAAAFRRDTSEIAAGAIDPGFAEGRVTSNRNGVLGVRGSDQILHRILVTSATSLWKMDPIPVSQVAVGDGLYARGARLPDGTLAADAVWVNLVNVDADIAAISTARVDLSHNGHRIVAHVVKGKTAVTYRSEPASGDLSKLRVGHHVRVLGLWHPDTNEMSISTLHSMATS